MAFVIDYYDPHTMSTTSKTPIESLGQHWSSLTASTLVIASLLAVAPVSFAQSAPSYDAATIAKYDKNANGLMDPSEVDTMNAEKAAAASGVVAMNPFVVSSDKDKGFQVMSVGSGSRLKIDLADTPVAYSVINREFIDALNIIDMIDAASWATGQTFYSTDNGGHGRDVSINVRGNQVNNRVGSSPGSQRNFYANASTSNDSFAVESFDFGRGPNSALFGNTGTGSGGLAGIQSTQTKQARFDRSTTAISLTTDQYKGKRATLDVNMPLSSKIGLRVNTVYSDLREYQIMERQKTKGLAINLKIQLTPTTELSFDGDYEWHAFHNVGSGYDEYISGWDGATVFRGPITNSMLTTTATIGATNITSAAYGSIQVYGTNPVNGQVGLAFGGEPNGVTRFGNNVYMYDPYAGTVMNYANFPITRRADNTSRIPLWSYNAPNQAYYQRASMPVQGNTNASVQPSFGVGRMGMYTREMLPQDMYARLERNSKFRLPALDWQGSYDHMTNIAFTKDLQFDLSQRLGEHMFLSVGGDTNKNFSITNAIDDPNSSGNGFRSVTLDIDMIKPDGSPNPNFLNPWSASFDSDDYNWVADSALRVNLGYTNLDLGRWGNYTFNLQGNMSQEHSDSKGYTWSMKLNADPRQWGNDTLRNIVYWGDRVHAFTQPTTVKLTRVTFDAATTENPVIGAPEYIHPGNVLTSWGSSFNKTKYALIQTTAKYWNNKVIATGAFRRDNTFNKGLSSIAIGTLPMDWDGQTIYFRPDAPADYFSMTYIPKNPATGAVLGNGKPQIANTRPMTTINNISVPNPVFVNDRFRSDFNSPQSNRAGTNVSMGLVYHATRSVSVEANYSNSYTPPSSTSLDMAGDVRLPVKSFGWDMSVALTLLNGNLTAKFNYFKNTRQNDSGTSPSATAINTLYEANKYDDPDSTGLGRNALGIPSLPGSDYQDTRNDGREIDLAATPIRGWRITANGSWTFKTLSNLYRVSKTWIPEQDAQFREVLEDAGGRVDTSLINLNAPHAPGVAVPGDTHGGVAIDMTNAINAYNNIWLNYETVLVNRQARAPQQPTVNIFNDYTIQSGALKGLKIGAGVQWQGQMILGNFGNQTMLDPNNPVPTAIDDPSYTNFDYRFMKGSYKSKFTLGYTIQQFFGNPMTLNLIIDNPVNNTRPVQGDAGLGGGTGFGGVFRQPDSNMALPNRVPSPDLISRFQAPMNWSLTASYRFSGAGRR